MLYRFIEPVEVVRMNENVSTDASGWHRSPTRLDRRSPERRRRRTRSQPRPARHPSDRPNSAIPREEVGDVLRRKARPLVSQSGHPPTEGTRLSGIILTRNEEA